MTDSRFKIPKQHNSMVGLQDPSASQQQLPMTSQDSQVVILEAEKLKADQISITNYASATKADSSHNNMSLSHVTMNNGANIRVSAPTSANYKGTAPRQQSRPQTAKYNSRQELSNNITVDVKNGNNITSNGLKADDPINLLGAHMARVNSAKELPLKFHGRKSNLRSRRTVGVSHVVSQSTFSQNKSPVQNRNMTTTGVNPESLQSLGVVAYLEGQSHHSFGLGAKTPLVASNLNNRAKHMRSRSRKRQFSTSKNDIHPVLDATLKERIKALKASKKISHRIGAGDNIRK